MNSLKQGLCHLPTGFAVLRAHVRQHPAIAIWLGVALLAMFGLLVQSLALVLDATLS